MSGFSTRTIGAALLLLISLPAIAQKVTLPVWKVYYDSGNLYMKSDALRSVRLFTKAENIARNDLGIYDDNYLVILNGLGLAHERARNFEQARKYLSETVSLSREVYKNDDSRLFQSLYNLGMLMRKTGRNNESLKIFKDILALSGKANDRTFYVLAATQLVNNHESLYQLDSAISIAQQTMASQVLKDHESIAYELRVAEGRILRKLKRYDESQKAFIAVNKQLVARGAAFRVLSRSVNIQLALLDTDLGLYGKAERDLLQLYRLAKTESNADVSTTTEIANALAFVYEKLGIYDKAIAYYQESLSLCASAVGESIGSCEAIENNIAGIYLKQKQFDKAISNYRTYVESRKDAGRFDDPEFLTVLNNLATALRQNDQYEEALKYLNDVHKSLKERNRENDDLAATVLNNIAVTQTMMGQYTQATTNFQQALQIKESYYGSESPLLLDLCSNLAVALWASGKKMEATPYFERSLRIGLKEVQYNFQNLTEAEQVSFYARQKENFERFNTLAVQSAKDTPQMLLQMFNNQVFLKSLVFFTNRRATILAKNINDPLLNNTIELKQLKSTRLGHYYQTQLKELGSQKISLRKLENEIDSLDKIIRHRLSANADENPDVSWSDVQKSLGPDEASVDIIRFRKYDVLPAKNSTTSKVKIGFTDSVYYAALITTKETKKNPELILLKNGRELESRFFNYYRNAIKFNIDDTITIDQYWTPVAEQLKNKKTIHFSPDGVFRQLNMNTLHRQNKPYNIETFDIRNNLNPASIADNNVQQQINLANLVLIGDPVFGVQQAEVGVNSIQSGFTTLPGTQQEITEISRLIKSTPPPVQYVRAQASEQNLRNVKSPGVLHIATHGFFAIDVSYLNEQVKSDYLFHSGLLLSSGKSTTHPAENDGIITSYDILNLDLRKTDLVVLSACETGLGKNEYGEGVHGLQRSFMHAGAKNIVISLWRVDDRVTKDLMVKFYQYLQQKKSANEALRLAQIDIMKKEPTPRLWGSFVTIGSN